MSDYVMGVKQKASYDYFSKMPKFPENKTPNLHDVNEARRLGFLDGWEARDVKMGEILFNNDETVSMKDPVEIALLAFTNGYARGIKENEK